MYEIPKRYSQNMHYLLYKKVKKDYDNTLPERNLSSIVNDSALKIDFSKFLKTQQFYQF